MHRAGRFAIAVGVAAAAALYLHARWSVALTLAADTRGVPPELMLEVQQPGLLDAVRLVETATAPVWTMPRTQAPLVHQRLLEAVYPRRLRPYDLAALRAGDLVVLAAGHDLPVPADEVHARGEVRVVRVR